MSLLKRLKRFLYPPRADKQAAGLRPPLIPQQIERRDANRRFRTLTLKERFWDKVDSSGDCWLWTGKRMSNGYGFLQVQKPRRKSHLAHRLAWEFAHGEPTQGMVVFHSCESRHCVNPAHLICGSQADNMAHMRAAGRGFTPPRKAGQNNPSAKLTAEQVLEIRRRYRPYTVGYPQLAKEFGVSKACIESIVKRKYWASLEETNGSEQ